MSEVDRIMYSDDNDQLDHLLNNVQLMEQNSDDDGGNNKSNLHGSQVPLFTTVRSPTDVSHSEMDVAPGEGSNAIWRNGGGPCQRKTPSPNNIGEKSFWSCKYNSCCAYTSDIFLLSFSYIHHCNQGPSTSGMGYNI